MWFCEIKRKFGQIYGTCVLTSVLLQLFHRAVRPIATGNRQLSASRDASAVFPPLLCAASVLTSVTGGDDGCCWFWLSAAQSDSFLTMAHLFPFSC